MNMAPIRDQNVRRVTNGCGLWSSPMSIVTSTSTGMRRDLSVFSIAVRRPSKPYGLSGAIVTVELHPTEPTSTSSLVGQATTPISSCSPQNVLPGILILVLVSHQGSGCSRVWLCGNVQTHMYMSAIVPYTPLLSMAVYAHTILFASGAYLPLCLIEV
jgi:hypothetical protein